jgi:hypothetical protein
MVLAYFLNRNKGFNVKKDKKIYSNNNFLARSRIVGIYFPIKAEITLDETRNN